MRNGKTNKTVTLGENIWMAENLSINFINDKSQITCYDDDADYCATYGRLYSFDAATDKGKNFSSSNATTTRGACPLGWHIPTQKDLFNLTANYNMVGNYDALKSAEGWPQTGMATTSSARNGFSALPGGYHNGTYFNGLNSTTYFWGISEDGESATTLAIGGSFTNVYSTDQQKNKAYLRCVYDKQYVDPNAIHYIWVKSSKFDTELPTVVIGCQQWIAKDLGYYKWSENGVCPTDIGFHRASVAEWKTLLAFAGSAQPLKSKASWNKHDGTDHYGFTLQALGAYNYTDNGNGSVTYTEVYGVGSGIYKGEEFSGIGEMTRFWTTNDNVKSATTGKSVGVSTQRFGDFRAVESKTITSSKSSRLPIRCVRTDK